MFQGLYWKPGSVSSQKSSHCKHTVSIIISVTKKYHTGCIVFNPLLHILNFEIFVLLIMHKNICHCKIIHKNHECNGFTLSFLFFYYWLLTLGCQSEVFFLPPFHEMIICRSKKLNFVKVFVFMKFITDLLTCHNDLNNKTKNNFQLFSLDSFLCKILKDIWLLIR